MKTKNLLLIICLLCSSIVCAQNSTINKIFDKYEDEDNIVIISISKAMFKLIPGNINAGNIDISNIIPKIESMRLMTSSKKEIKEKLNLEIKKLIDSDKNYETLMRIKDGKSNTIFSVRNKDNFISELIMLIDNEESFTVIYITGNFVLEDIQKIAENIQ
jgi:hypothetical protein